MTPAKQAWPIVTLAALFLWVLVGAVSGVAEPWDWAGYPAALAIAAALTAACGYLLPRGAGWWGPIVIFCQLPVMLLHATPGPLLPVGLLLLALQSVPAAFVGMATAHLRRRI